jgi:hypothetical protein
MSQHRVAEPGAAADGRRLVGSWEFKLTEAAAAAELGRSAAEALAVFEFRVTKYDPAHRDRHGAYTRDEWTAASDIDRAFNGVVLTAAEYQRTEDAYATAAVEFLREAGVSSLAVAGLENHAGVPLPFAEGASLGLAEIGEVVRRLLRAEFWCRLEGVGAFVHVGYDYYMYVGVPVACPGAAALARQLGLFPEPFRSPYRE